MKRHEIVPRSDWQASADEIGFTYYATAADPDYGTNWNESCAYEFTAAEVDEIESATEELHARCLDAVDYVVKHPEVMTELGIPTSCHSYVQHTWNNQHPSLYGRFDLAYDGKTPPKMLEYNADTPTMLIESAVMQWTWLQAVKPTADQFNSVHEKLLEEFSSIKSMMPKDAGIYFAGLEDKEEERQTCRYLQDLATQAGIFTAFINLKDIGYDSTARQFVDMQNYPINFCFKLYPWEWIFVEEFGKGVVEDSVGWLEPAWKSILSNKGILPILWKLFPNHPNLLKSSFSAEDFGDEAHVAKPFLSREGQNIQWFKNKTLVEATDGVYNNGKFVYQEAANLFNQNGHYAVIGSWIVGQRSAGIIVRDNPSKIVHDRSDVVPHWFV